MKRVRGKSAGAAKRGFRRPRGSSVASAPEGPRARATAADARTPRTAKRGPSVGGPSPRRDAEPVPKRRSKSSGAVQCRRCLATPGSGEESKKWLEYEFNKKKGEDVPVGDKC